LAIIVEVIHQQWSIKATGSDETAKRRERAIGLSLTRPFPINEILGLNPRQRHAPHAAVGIISLTSVAED